MPLANQRFVTTALVSPLAMPCILHGVDLDGVSQSDQIPPSFHLDSNSYFRQHTFAFMLERLAAAAQDEAWGLKYAMRFRLADLDPFALCFRHAPTIGEALRFYVRHASIVEDQMSCALGAGTTTACLQWRYPASIAPANIHADFSMCLLLRQLRMIARANWQPAAVRLQRERPSNILMHQECLSLDVSFESETNALTLPVELLATEVAGADPKMFAIMDWKCEDRRKEKQRLIGLEVAS